MRDWWDMPGSDRRPLDPKSSALPSELIPRMAGQGGLEPPSTDLRRLVEPARAIPVCLLSHQAGPGGEAGPGLFCCENMFQGTWPGLLSETGWIPWNQNAVIEGPDKNGATFFGPGWAKWIRQLPAQIKMASHLSIHGTILLSLLFEARPFPFGMEPLTGFEPTTF